MTEGRTHDYFFDEPRGMIFFTRYFLPPARYQMPIYGGATGAFRGEFRFSVKADYAWGKDLEVAKDFHIAKNLATKMAAIECLSSSNFIAMIPENAAVEPLAQRIDRWEREIDEQLENLTGLIVE